MSYLSETFRSLIFYILLKCHGKQEILSDCDFANLPIRLFFSLLYGHRNVVAALITNLIIDTLV